MVFFSPAALRFGALWLVEVRGQGWGGLPGPPSEFRSRLAGEDLFERMDPGWLPHPSLARSENKKSAPKIGAPGQRGTTRLHQNCRLICILQIQIIRVVVISFSGNVGDLAVRQVGRPSLLVRLVGSTRSSGSSRMIFWLGCTTRLSPAPRSLGSRSRPYCSGHRFWIMKLEANYRLRC